ncbi:flagellar basal body rod protein FlgB [Marinobacterium sp. D7]|uniref:flagellar basal body rod protein FlgB n=1 Tax=Marinobacterium ramblicola TaxID=2849041 RepID=UPI001C2DBAAD|nr:flagellar basal body rod protein FlgB [Marinobacterium ramblicola]MBV1787728.1 flagellar basal body rod protein FlgB [Marinobacterium ramblicola]
MIEDVGGVTSQLVSIALDAAKLRHEVIANNIANVNTPGFYAKRMQFEELLSGALDRYLNNEEGIDRTQLDLIKEKVEDGAGLIFSTSHLVELDQEMIRLAENTLRYEAIIKANGKRGDIIKMAVNEGKR